MCRKLFSRVAAALALAACLTAGASAQEVLLEDDFSELDPSLANGSVVGVEDNMLYIQLTAEHWWNPLYQAMLFEDIDMTTKVRLPDPSGEVGHIVGVVFWARNSDDFYVLEISDSGTYAVAHSTPERWTFPISWRSTDALKTEPGEWNELRVVASGRRATVYINGQQLGSFKGNPPDGGSLVGFFTQVGSEDARGEFSSMRIVEGPAGKEEDDDPNVYLADDFSMLDPGWGSERGWFGVKNNHLFIEFDPNQSYTALHEANVVQDADITVKVKMIDGNPDAVCGGAIAFWATNATQDYWIFELYDNGNFGVYRRVKDRWLTPLSARAAPPEAKIDFSQPIELRVVTSGRKATFYINGVEVGSIMGQPPKNGFMFGLYGESGDAALTHEFSDFVARKP